MTMVEEIARAIYGATPHNKPFEQYVLHYQPRQALYAEALAALKAMREPGDKMLSAGAFHCIQHAGPAGAPELRQAKNVIVAAIDAAIAEHEGRE